MAKELEVLVEEISTKPSDTVSKSVFVVRFPTVEFSSLTANRVQNVWEATWKRAGHKVPMLIILGNDIKIEALSDAELKSHGLVRIPEDIADSDESE